MYKDFIVKKQSGTYAETLEAYGVANLINEILIRSNLANNVIIEDKKTHYLVSSNKEITEEMIGKVKYFQIVKFILKDQTKDLPDGVIDYYDVQKQKGIMDEFSNRRNEISTNSTLNQDQKKIASKALLKERLGEFGYKIDSEFGVYREISKNPYLSFLNIFENINSNKSDFSNLINTVMTFYTTGNLAKSIITLVDANPTAQLLYNPSQGKGLNKNKANNASMGNLSSGWIRETMKISGALSMMICQYVKSGTSRDLKIFVPEFHHIGIMEARNIIFEFKKSLSSSTAIKSDIINILDLSVKFIERTPEYKRGKIKNTIKGFHVVYQKKLGGPTKPGTVSNIGFINTPNFIEYLTTQEGKDWIDILEQQRSLVSNIEELGDSIQGLNNYRNFLGSSNQAALNNFNKFSYWYAGYLMQQLTKGNNFIRTFNTDSLTKLYKFMEPNLTEIIHNDGFKAVAKAIRNSTIKLQKSSGFQITHKRFQIRYGLAQELNNKSKSKTDFTTFIGEFLAKYDAETAKHKQNNESILFRPNVREDEKNKFFELLDIYPSKLVGALLSSYGFALEKYEKSDDDRLQQLQEAASKLGYQLIKIEEQIKENEIDQIEELENN